MQTDEIQIQLADLSDPRQATNVVQLLDRYARDPMGGGEPLSESTRSGLIEAMQARPGLFSVLVYVDDQAVALANCIMSFSTFAARDVINIHDVFVMPEFRGQRICQRLFDFIEDLAKERGCCKLTLEVLDGNDVAKQLYQKLGYGDYELDPEAGKALFWQKKI